MEIQQKDNAKTGMFFIEQEGKKVAKMIYTWAGDDRIIIEHTEVDDILKGQGAGKALVAKSVEFAREKGIKIVPICSFAKSVFNKTKEYQDVL
jgi:predicted GNAT family acetyltransferase